MDRCIASVVIPTHNRRPLLAEAVASSLEQTCAAVEVIIVDDGSTDGTQDFVATRLDSAWPHTRVRYFRQDQAGASAARNRGMREARGDFVQFLDSDDLLHRTKIDRQIAALERNPGAPCCSCYGTMVEWVDGEPRGPGVRIGSHATDSRQLVLELCSRRVHGMSTPAPLWRRAFLLQRPGWREDIALGDDLEYYVRLLLNAQRVTFVPESLFVVRIHGGSRLSADRMTEASLASLLRARREIFAALQGAGHWDDRMQSAFLSAMRTYYANALKLGRLPTIQALEDWLELLAETPKRRHAVRGLILARRLLGREILLGAHRFMTRLPFG